MSRRKLTGRNKSHATLVDEGRISHKSKVKSPVKFAWEVFDQLRKHLGEKLTRKLAIDTATKKGIAFYTARTQWQEWKMAGDRDRATQERLYGPSNKYIQG